MKQHPFAMLLGVDEEPEPGCYAGTCLCGEKEGQLYPARSYHERQ